MLLMFALLNIDWRHLFYRVPTFLCLSKHWKKKSKFSSEKYHLSLVMRKPDFRICENKAADQLWGNRTADQCLCFRYMDSTIPLLPKSEISSL